MFRRLRRRVRWGKKAVRYGAVRSTVRVLGSLSLESALVLADRVGDFAFVAFPKTRRLALEHIEIILGDSPSVAACRRIARAAFRNMARCFCEVAKFDVIRERLDEYVEVQGWEHLEAVLETGRGGIAITGLVGNWELIAAYCALKGIPVGVIARRTYETRLNQLVVDFRHGNGVKTIFTEGPSSSREMEKVLSEGGVLVLLLEPQAEGGPPTSVPVFGRMARTPSAAAALAVRRELPVLPVVTQRRPDRGHRLTFFPPIQANKTGDRRRDAATLARRFNEHLESAIRRNPVESVW